MKRNRKRYTPEEDDTIFRAVSDATSMNECFAALSQQLGRSKSGIATRWYADLSNPNSKYYMGTAMLLIKRRAAGINRTNVNKFPVEIKPSFWKRVLMMFRLCQKL